MQFQKAGSNFFDELFGILTAFEGPRRKPYDAKDGVITIGVGFNLTGGVAALREGVYTQFGLKTTAKTEMTPAALLERGYLLRLDAAIAAGPSEIPTLNTIMAERYAKAGSDSAFADYIGTSTPRQKFEFSESNAGLAEMKAVMQFGSTKYVNAVYTKLGYTEQTAPAGFNDSWEKAVLISLAYNGMGAWPSGLTSAIKSGNRAEAWFQIRYASNYIGRKYSQGIALQDKPNTTKDEQGYFDQGIDKGWAKRRYAESQLFGLYDNPLSATSEESRKVYQMLQIHRKQILDYEKVYGIALDGSTGSRGNQAAAASSDPNYMLIVGTEVLAASLEPAKKALLTDLRARYGNYQDRLSDGAFNPMNIYVANFSGDLLDDAASRSGLLDVSADPTLRGAGANDLIVGTTGGDMLTAANVDSVLIGEAGSDWMTGGTGNDLLIGGKDRDNLRGGAGNDTYVFTAGDGQDIIIDNDGLGSIVLGGTALTGATQSSYVFLSTQSQWSLNDGEIIYTLDEKQKRLVITGKSLGADSQITVKLDDEGLKKLTGSEGYLGLKLERTPKVALLQGGSSNVFAQEGFDIGSLAGQGSGFNEGAGKSFTLYLNQAAKAGDTLTLALSGLVDKFQVILGDSTVPANGAVITLSEGQTEARFALVECGDIQADTSVQISASYTSGDEHATSNSWGVALTDTGKIGQTMNGDQRAMIIGVGKETQLDVTPDKASYGTYAWNETSWAPDGTLINGLPEPGFSDVIRGTGGNDKIYGMLGNDALDGGAGNDEIDGGEGDDLIGGGAGSDSIRGGNGNDLINSSATLSVRLRNKPTDSWSPPAGNYPVVTRGAVWGAYEVTGGITWDGSNGPRGTDGDVVDGGAGNDCIITGGGDDRAQGGTGNDKIVGREGNDILEGGDGNDKILGDGFVESGYLETMADADHGNDFIDGGEGNDTINGGGGSDVIFGGAGDDYLYGDSTGYSFGTVSIEYHGDDYIDGEDGNDRIVGGRGNNTLRGGAGDNTIYAGDDHGSYWKSGSGNNMVYGGSGRNTIYGSGGNDTLISGSESGTGNVTAIRAGDGNAYIVGGEGDDFIYGGAGDNTIYAGTGNSTIKLSGNTTVYGCSGTMFVLGGAGTDVIYAGDGGTVDEATVIVAGSGTSTIYGGAGVSHLKGGSGNDTLVAGTGTCVLQGGTGTDVMYSNGNATLIAGTGNDTLYGGSGDDVLQGSVGNTLFVAGSGNEVIIAGTGSNTFEFNAGFGHVVLRNTSGSDTIRFGAGIRAADLTISTVLNGDGNPALLITDGCGGEIVADVGFAGALGLFAFTPTDNDNAAPMSIERLLAQATVIPGTVQGASGSLVLEGGESPVIGFTDNADQINETARALPTLRGSGTVLNLSQAASLQTTEGAALLTVLGTFNAATTGVAQHALIDTLLDDWAATSTQQTSVDVAATNGRALRYYHNQYAGGGVDRLESASITKIISVMERFNGTNFEPYNHVSSKTGDVDIELTDLENALFEEQYSKLRDAIYGGLAMQSRLKPYMDSIGQSIAADGSTQYDFTAFNGKIASLQASDPQNALLDLVELRRYAGAQLAAKGVDVMPKIMSMVHTLLGTPELTAVRNLHSVFGPDDWIAGGVSEAIFAPVGGKATIVGTAENDIVFGSVGNDTLEGGTGDDILDGGACADQLNGGLGDDTLDGGAGNDTLDGGAGDDTYLFGFGSGHDVIDDSASSKSVIKLASGISPTDVTLTRNGSNGLTLALVGGTDSITFDNWYYVSDHQSEQAVFADGTVWDLTQLSQSFAITGTAGDDSLRAQYGTTDGHVFNGLAGNDDLNGSTGDDTYIFGFGSGHDIVYESGGYNTVQLSAGVAATDVTLTRDRNDTLVLSLDAGKDTLELRSWYGNKNSLVQRLAFADGTEWNLAEMAAKLPVTALGTAGNDSLSSADTFNGLAGNDTLYGSRANDTYIFDFGSDHDTIWTDSSGINTIQMSVGVSPSDVSLSRDKENDLILTLTGGADTISVKNQYSACDTTIQKVTFADGTVWDLAQMASLLPLVDWKGNGLLIGGNVSHIYDGLDGNDTLVGGTGDDTYRFGFGSGQDLLVDNPGNNTIQMAAGVSTSDVTLSRDKDDNLILTLTGGTNLITLSGSQKGGACSIQYVTFVDGTVWNLKRAAAGMPTQGHATCSNNGDGSVATTYSDAAGNVTGSTVLADDGNGNTSIINRDASGAKIDGSWTKADGSHGTDRFYADGSSSGTAYNADSSYSTYANDMQGGITTTSYDAKGVKFSSYWVKADGSSGLTRFDSSGTISGVTLTGGQGSNTYQFEADFGNVVVIDTDTTPGNEDTIEFGEGIVPESMHVARSGLDLLLTLGSNNIKVQDWFASADHQIEKIVFKDATVWTPVQIRSMTNAKPMVSQELSDQTTNEDSTFGYSVPANAFDDADPDDALTYTASLADGAELPTWLAFDGATGTFSGTPGNADVGAYALHVTATDRWGASAAQTFTLTVDNVNDVPLAHIALDDQTATEGQALNFTLPADSFIDIDTGDVLSYAASMADGTALPDWLVFDVETRTFSGIPPKGSAAELALTVTARDQADAFARQEFRITVIATSGEVGTPGNDVLIATEGDSYLDGGAGNDQLQGSWGSDTLRGGVGDDVLYAGGGERNVLSGGDGNDRLYADWGSDVLEGGAGDNVLQAGGGDNTVTAGMGDDTIGADWGNDMIDAGDGNNRINAGGGNNRITSGAGADIIVADGNNQIVSGAGNDTISTTWGDDVIDAGEGDNNISAGYGTNRITSGSGNDTISADGASQIASGGGNDVVVTSWGNDLLDGGSGDDHLDAGGGNDTLMGGDGTDVLQGGYGDDLLVKAGGAALFIGGAGNDSARGGTDNGLYIGGFGNDLLEIGGRNDVVLFNRGDGQDTVVSSATGGAVLSLGGGIGYDELSLSKAGDDLTLSAWGDQITFKNWYATTPSKPVANLQVIADAMAGFAAGGSDPLRDQKVETFNFAGLVDAFDAARAANTGLSSWALTDALTQFQIAGSDTAALGGDLAYQYGKNGTLAGIGLTSAQTIIADTNFGSQAQTLQALSSLQTGTVRLS